MSEETPNDETPEVETLRGLVAELCEEFCWTRRMDWRMSRDCGECLPCRARAAQ